MPLTLNGTSGVTAPQGAVYNGLQMGTAQNVSGASVDITGIPLWAKRVTVLFSGVSLTGSAYMLLRVGSGSIQATGYSSGVWSNSTNTTTSTTAFAITANGSNLNTWHGSVVLFNISGNTWTCSVALGQQGGTASYTATGGGSVTLAGALDRVRLLNDGADTFDAGSVNIMYE